ncbi:MAG: stationary phase survival protein SurE [Epsilonproteobacteria bacterium]|nr:stationary phase survival protein SurE [Campylobacterota bacterium]
MYKNFIRDDIDIKILSNYPFFLADREEDFEKFKKKLSSYDVGVFVKSEKLKMKSEKLNFSDLRVFNSLGEELSWDDVVLNYLKSLNSFMREQIGVCVEKTLPRVIDNELTYLIIQRKNYKDFNDNFFIALDGEVIFPMINKEFDINLAVVKLAEWKNRAGIKELIKFK